MGGGPTHPAYPGLFLWLSVNKIQLFSALQMQPPSVCLCNKPCTPSGPRYIQRTKREVKPSLLSGSSYQHPAHQAPPRPISPPCCPLRETTPALTSHILLTQPTLPRFLEGDLPPTHRETLGQPLPNAMAIFPPLSPLHPPTHQPACFIHPHATSKWHSCRTHQLLTPHWSYCCCLASHPCGF